MSVYRRRTDCIFLSQSSRLPSRARGLQVGDIINWRDKAIELEGQPAVVTPGMRGKVLSLHDGFHLDVDGGAIPPKAVVQFESGMRLMVDERMKWSRSRDE